MSRNVVVSFTEGYSDILDEKKYGARYMIFCSRFGGGLYSRGGGVLCGGLHEALEDGERSLLWPCDLKNAG